MGGAGRGKNDGTEIGRYVIEESENQLLYHEGPLQGALHWDGEWFTGTLADKLNVEGEIRLRKYRRGVQSQFRKAGEEHWDGLIIAKKVRALAKKHEASEGQAPESSNTQMPESTKAQISAPLDQTEVEVDEMNSAVVKAPMEEVPMRFKPSVGTWLMPLPQPQSESLATGTQHELQDLQVTPASMLLSFVSADLSHPREQHELSRVDLDCDTETFLKKAVEQFEPADEVEETIFTLFKSIDANHDGSVNRTEFFSGLWGTQANELLKELGVADKHLSGTGHEVLQELYELADADGNGVITFFEFMHAMKQQVGQHVPEN